MLKKFAAAAVHLVFFALVTAIAAYWAVRVFTPAPSVAPPPMPPPPLREPDPVATARMFGKVDVVQAVATNIQAIGVFSAGEDSSAVLAVDGRPARVFLLGQEVVSGSRLVAVNPDFVVLESAGGRQEVRLPVRTAVSFGGAPPPPNFVREGNTLTAPSVGGPLPPRPAQPAPPPSPPPPAMTPGTPPPPSPPPPSPPVQAQ